MGQMGGSNRDRQGFDAAMMSSGDPDAAYRNAYNSKGNKGGGAQTGLNKQMNPGVRAFSGGQNPFDSLPSGRNNQFLMKKAPRQGVIPTLGGTGSPYSTAMNQSRGNYMGGVGQTGLGIRR